MSDITEELESTKLSLHNAKELADVRSNPVVETMITNIKKIFPPGVLLDAAFKKKLEEFQGKKEKELIDIVRKDEHSITSEMVNDVQFIVNFNRTLEAVRRLATNDKVKYFGNLIRNGYLSGEYLENDEFEEYLDILVTMSYREIECLSEFYYKSLSTKGKIIAEDWELFKINSRYSETDVSFIFKRLSRTGFINECHTVISIDGGGAEEDNIGVNINGTFQGYELDESFMRFYNMVLKMEK